MASAAQRNIRSISYAKYGYFFILPFFLVYCFFQLWPLINTFILSFKGNGKKLMNLLAWATLKLCCSVLVTWDVQHRLFMKHFSDIR